ncbi:MAG: hypothetical protein OXC19_03750 [Bryobacterales bacterium]|nr:hypothetical protein [Bryobacterales bacterium]
MAHLYDVPRARLKLLDAPRNLARVADQLVQFGRVLHALRVCQRARAVKPGWTGVCCEGPGAARARGQRGPARSRRRARAADVGRLVAGARI